MFKPFGKKQNFGAVLIFSVFGLFFMVGVIAIVVDVGWMYFQKIRLESAVNSAWKGGFDESNRLSNSSNGAALTEDQKNLVRSRIKNIFVQNGFTEADADAVNISFSGVASYPGHLEVSTGFQFGLFFAPVLNFINASVFASRGGNSIGTGSLDNGLGGGEGIVPIGIPHGVLQMADLGQGNKEQFKYRNFQNGETFVVGQEYIIRLGVPTGPGAGGDGFALKSTSNHGSLDLGNKGGGADEYRDGFINGYKGSLNINDRTNLKTGEMDGPVDIARVTRINNSERSVIIPIVDLPPEANEPAGTVLYELSGTSKPVRIIGFAIFNLINPGEAVSGATLGGWESNGHGQLRGNFVKYIVNPWDAIGVLN